MSGKTVPSRDTTGKSVPYTAGGSTHGVKAATRSATRVKAAASVKTAGGAHAAWMEATSAGMEASTTYMKTSTTGMKASTSAGMKSAAAAMEAATAASVKAAASTSTSVKAATSTASTAAAARGRLRQAGECEAGNCACEECGNDQRSLSAGNAHVFLPCKTAVGKPATPHCFRNGLV